MAAPPYMRTVPNTPLSNRYQNGDGPNPIEARLPSGRCNYTNLSLGANAPTCGCKRFYDKALGTPSINGDGRGGLSQGRTGFCMCEHHACYHDHNPEGRRALGDVFMGEGRSTTPRPSTLRQTAQLLDRARIQDENSQVGRLQEPSLPDTLQWSRFIQSQSSPGALPAIPSQCLLPSEDGSRTSGSQTAYRRPFGGLGLHTLSPKPKPNSGHTTNPGMGQMRGENSWMQLYEDANGGGYLQSLTEVATPNIRASQDPGVEADFSKNVASVQDALEKLADKQAKASHSAAAPRTFCKEDTSQVLIKQSGPLPEMDSLTVLNDNNDSRLIPRLQNIVGQIADYPVKLQNHEQRLDLLENSSFSNAAIEELQEASDHMDTRVGELEGRVDELEKAHNAQGDASSVGSRHNIEGSFDSRISNTSSVMIAAAMDHIDPSRVEALEAQVAELQAIAAPCHARPWEVEVVFLPFGTNLMGIWSSQHIMTQRSRLDSTATDDWTQTQHKSMAAAQACLTAHNQASAWERSATDLGDEEATWLIARACGIRSRVDERLRSRGLVRTVQICGPDARDVQAAIMTTFGDLPTVLTEDPFTQHDENIGMVPRSLRSYLGLQASWIPLRKLHKDSCLRFLTPSEMVTHALWTVPFLSSSVAMRHKGTRRLYVTQRDSYIQHLGDSNANWTWQKLRQLPRVYPDQPSFAHTPEADAQEECWAFDPRLDPPPSSTHSSFQSSFASHISSLSIQSPANSPGMDNDLLLGPASPSDHFSSAAASATTSTPRTSVAPPLQPLSPLKERNPFRPIHSHTPSIPSLVSVPLRAQSSPLQTVFPPTKRRIASFEQESPTKTASTQNLALSMKRRRTRSPSRPRDTPRWSIGPPSPYPFPDDITERKRGTTPFAYATPHSNAPPYVEGSRPRSGIDVYVDSDEDEDHDDDRGSTTDDFNIEEGYENHALSDFESDAGSPELGHEAQVDDEWDGVQDDVLHGQGKAHESQVAGKVSGLVGLRHEEVDDDQASEASSQPSEYPSTQQHSDLYASTKAGFRIHVDEEIDAVGA